MMIFVLHLGHFFCHQHIYWVVMEVYFLKVDTALLLPPLIPFLEHLVAQILLCSSACTMVMVQLPPTTSRWFQGTHFIYNIITHICSTKDPWNCQKKPLISSNLIMVISTPLHTQSCATGFQLMFVMQLKGQNGNIYRTGKTIADAVRDIICSFRQLYFFQNHGGILLL